LSSSGKALCALRSACVYKTKQHTMWPPAAALLLVLAALVALLHGTTAASATSSATPALELCASQPYASAGLATAMTSGGAVLKVYHNLYYHNGKWYAITGSDGGSGSDNSSSTNSDSSIDLVASLNVGIIRLPAADAPALHAALAGACHVRGATLLVDLPFPAYPDNLGHWAEMAWPAYGAFADGNGSAWREALKRPRGGGDGSGSSGDDSSSSDGGDSGPFIDRVLLVNARAHLLDWVRSVLSIVLGHATRPEQSCVDNSSGSQGSSGSPGRLPPLVEGAALSDFSRGRWLAFEAVVVVQGRYAPPHVSADTRDAALAAVRAAAAAAGAPAGLVGGDSRVGFATPDLAHAFRSEAYAFAGWPAPWLDDGRSSAAGECAALAAAAAAECSSTKVEPAGSTVQKQQQQNKQQPFLPRVVTVMLDADTYPPITNHAALVDALADVAELRGWEVHAASLTMEAPFASHLALMAGTGLLVARHGPILASAVLLPPGAGGGLRTKGCVFFATRRVGGGLFCAKPGANTRLINQFPTQTSHPTTNQNKKGAAVVELLPYRWDWRGLGRLYTNMTASSGDLHHWGWRARRRSQCKYATAGDAARYGGWRARECGSRGCLEAHAAAGLEVDVGEVAALIARKLPKLEAGASVAELAEPWPDVGEDDGDDDEAE
jgi:hypothetical protein